MQLPRSLLSTLLLLSTITHTHVVHAAPTIITSLNIDQDLALAARTRESTSVEDRHTSSGSSPSPPPYFLNTQDDSTLSDQTTPTPDLLIPSRYESTILGRRLLAQSSTGTLATIFPKNTTAYPRTPQDVSSAPIALPDYVASCEEPTGNPTILALKISTATRNVYAGSNVSLSLSWWDEYVQLTGHKPWSQANLPRLSMLGYLEEIEQEVVKEEGIEACYTKLHPDSIAWLPGRKWAVHEGVWMRLVVQEVYWVGGFGDANYIGWFDVEEWRAVTAEEWQGRRLPGEK